MHKTLWDYETRNDHLIPDREGDVVDLKVKIKESKKIDKYFDLSNLKKEEKV